MRQTAERTVTKWHHEQFLAVARPQAAAYTFEFVLIRALLPQSRHQIRCSIKPVKGLLGEQAG
jgi:hypothetical protein